MYKLDLQTGGKTYTSQGKTVERAFQKMNLRWPDIKIKGILNVSKNKHNIEHLFNVPQLRKIFGNKLIRSRWASNLEFLFKASEKTQPKKTKKQET